MTTQEIRNTIKNYKELQRLREELDAELEAAKDSLKAELEAQGVDELTVGEYRISNKAVTSTRVDTTAIKKALPDVAERFSKTSTTRRFCIA